jgi:hypothetical protein
VLLEAGVAYNEKGGDGRTPLDMTQGSNQAAYELLKEWEAKANSEKTEL